VTIASIPKGTCQILDSLSVVACSWVPNSIAHPYLSIEMIAGEAGVPNLQADQQRAPPVVPAKAPKPNPVGL